MSINLHLFRNMTQSKFVRSIFLQVLAIFLFVSVAIIAIAFSSFSSEINKTIISDKQRQLAVIEDTISKRMSETASIAYNIGEDPYFYLEPVEGQQYSGYEMSNTLGRYLVGNGFIEYLAYYRLSEPNNIYTSRGELAFDAFWSSYLGLDTHTAEEYTRNIQETTEVRSLPLFFGGDKAYLAYTCPLPQFSENPQAFVLMLIPFKEIEPMFVSHLADSYGKLAVFDADGALLYQMSTLEEDIPIDPSELKNTGHEEYVTVDGQKYVVQTQVSASNGWTYVSLLRLSDIVSGLAGRQLMFILLLLVLMFIAVFLMLLAIIRQYKPISKLAGELDDSGARGGRRNLIDEGTLLSNTFASLKDEGAQKRHFETAYHEAEAANKAKSAFLSSVSHDIRTPMNAIIGMTSMAQKHEDDREYVGECLQKVQVASQYLLDIINNVLDMSRIESGRFTLSEEPVELPKLVYGLITILNQSVETKRQKLCVEAENISNEKVIGDGVRLMQVFMNILSNSVKFTPEGGTLGFHIRQGDCSREGFGSYVFTFTDTGIGMSPEFVTQVFDTFSRASGSQALKVEGTGLGMAIAKNLVELMGGTIVCESELGRGTKFTVSLELKLADAESEAAAAAHFEKFRELPVLIAGGEDSLCAAQAKAFAEVGIRTDCEQSVSLAAGLARKAMESGRAYRLVLINQTPDDSSGIAAVREISAAAEGADTAYVLAAQDMTYIRQSDARDSGIDAIMQIPLFKSTLLRMLERTFDAGGVSMLSKSSRLELAGRRVLLADDNNMNREIACRMIAETGAEVTEAVTGKEALDAFAQHEPGYFDIILMDLQMPVMTGYEATAAIRALAREDAPSIPIFALTASTFDEDVRQVREAGMNGHIGKPYTQEELFKALATIVK